jgi:hypothetical protein
MDVANKMLQVYQLHRQGCFAHRHSLPRYL